MALGAFLGQRCEKILHPTYYASEALNPAQKNYIAMEKEFLVVVFAFMNFQSYFLGVKVIVRTDHTT